MESCGETSYKPARCSLSCRIYVIVT